MQTVPKFLVTWTVHYDEDGTPEEAARWARERMLDPESHAVFEVITIDNVKHHIDLDRPDNSHVELPVASLLKIPFRIIKDMVRIIKGRLSEGLDSEPESAKQAAAATSGEHLVVPFEGCSKPGAELLSAKHFPSLRTDLAVNDEQPVRRQTATRQTARAL